MNVKTLFTSLIMAILFSSCDPNADKQVGNRTTFPTNGTGNGGGTAGVGSAGSSTTDAPLDGGLSLLLLAGTAYGVKRMRGAKQSAKESKH